jgi:hypothetical protein
MSDQFWFNKPQILFEKNRLTSFWPSKYHSYEERINALTRFIVYCGTILSLHKRKSDPMVMALLLVFVLVVISKSKNKVMEKIMKVQYPERDCQSPTINNPMANQIPYDGVFRKKACNSRSVANDITNSLFAEFPTDGLSNMSKDFIERQFFSVPNTDIVNDQKGFATWLYGEPNKKMCKSDPSFCTGFDGTPSNF